MRPKQSIEEKQEKGQRKNLLNKFVALGFELLPEENLFRFKRTESS